MKKEKQSLCAPLFISESPEVKTICKSCGRECSCVEIKVWSWIAGVGIWKARCPGCGMEIIFKQEG